MIGHIRVDVQDGALLELVPNGRAGGYPSHRAKGDSIEPPLLAYARGRQPRPGSVPNSLGLAPTHPVLAASPLCTSIAAFHAEGPCGMLPCSGVANICLKLL